MNKLIHKTFEENKMDKVLYISYLFNPFQPFSGAAQRTNLLLRSLLERFEVDVLYFNHDDVAFEDNLLKNCNVYYKKIGLKKQKKKYCYWSSNVVFPINDECAGICKDFVSKTNYKYIVFRYLETVFLCGLENHKSIVVDVDDLPVDKFETLFAHNYRNKRVAFYLKKMLFRFHTHNAILKSHHVFFPNPKHAKYSNSSYLPNIPYPFFENMEIEHQSQNNYPILLFVGSMGYRANYEGLSHFLESIWPTVKKQLPEARFKIIGKELPVEIQGRISAIKDVDYCGFVDDVYAEYAKATVVVVPIYAGAGTNIKVLEGMSLGKACVISKFAARGFEQHLRNGNNILIAENDEDFSGKIVNVINNVELNISLGLNSQETVRQFYSFDNFSKIVLDAI